jgi:hypothetical protein
LATACSTTKKCGDRENLLIKKSENLKDSGALTVKGKYCLNMQRKHDEERAKVTGYVIDRRTGEYLSANINVVDTTIGTTSNDRGYFEVLLPPGDFRFSVSHIGNTTLVTKQIDIPEKSVTEIFFYLGTTIIN